MSYLTLNLLSGFVIGSVAVLLNMPQQMPERKYSEAIKLVKYFILGFSAGLVVLPIAALIQQAAGQIMVHYPEFMLKRGFKLVMGIGGVAGFAIGLTLGRRKAPKEA